MGYLGNRPAEAYSAFQKQDFSTSATTSYTLDHPVANQNEIALFINFVRQEPTTAYTASGTTLTLTSATSSSDDMYCVYLGKAVQTVNPPNSSVGSSQVSADLITGQTALGATPADTDELLISDAGTLKRVDYSYLKVDNTPAFLAYPSSAQSIPNNTNTTVVLDSEVYDTDNAFSSNTFTVPSGEGGKYLFYFKVRQNGNTQNRLYAYLEASISGSTSDFYTTENGGGGSYDSVQATGVINMSAGDTVVLKFYQNCGTANNIFSSLNHVHFGGHKLIGV